MQCATGQQERAMTRCDHMGKVAHSKCMLKQVYAAVRHQQPVAPQQLAFPIAPLPLAPLRDAQLCRANYCKCNCECDCTAPVLHTTGWSTPTSVCLLKGPQ
jgi:hypothetical protein